MDKIGLRLDSSTLLATVDSGIPATRDGEMAAGSGQLVHEELVSAPEMALARPAVEAADMTPLKQARRTAAIGTETPDFSYQAPWKRPFSRLAARIVLRLAGTLTATQRAFNEHTVSFVRRLGEKVEQLASERNLMARALDQVVSRSQENLRDLNDRLGHLAVARESTATVASRLELEVLELRRESAALARRVSELEETAPQHLLLPTSDRLDELYFDLEERYRSSREDTKEHLRAFLPVVREHGLATRVRPALDLGCGRGEWLELMAENGLVAHGLESNKTAVNLCRAAGLEVSAGNVPESLRRWPDASLGLVTAFHFLECLAFPMVFDLLTEVMRVLQPGGMVILETLNPENADWQAASAPYLHPAALLLFLLERCGFTELARADSQRPGAEIMLLDPEEPLASKLNPVIELLKARFAIPANYAIIGRKLDLLPAG